ncbi:MAG TPA: hypothetical protein VGJ20_08915 [Xanthobacteraceae bacterium]
MTAITGSLSRTAVLDGAHIGNIEGAFGPIRLSDRRRQSSRHCARTLRAILGPGFVMVGDSDAGAFIFDLPIIPTVRTSTRPSGHQQFFDDGGLDVLAGDGRLPHPGAEQIIETHYAFPCWQRP